MSTLAERLDRTLRAAGIPIDGVAVGDEALRATWVPRYLPNATVQQRATCDALIAAFDPVAQAVLDAETIDRATTALLQKDLLATLALVTSLTDPNWNTKTTPQKVAAVRATANTWKTLRAFAEANL